jgi:putative CocE/NonD family hydrolase
MDKCASIQCHSAHPLSFYRRKERLKMRKHFNRFFAASMAMTLFVSMAVASANLQIPMAPKQESKIPISNVLQKIITEKDVKAAIEQYYYLKENEPDKYDFSEPELNNLGYRLLNQKRIKDAIEIFKLNIEVFPNSVNPYDSLAEGYLNDGDVENAVKFYNKALEKDPNFAASITGLGRIFVMENYEKREYQIPMRDGIKLFTQVSSPVDRSKKYPILLFRTPYGVDPYGEEKLNYRYFLGPSIAFSREGFIFVHQDVRGKHMSEGKFIDMRPYISVKKGPSDIDESSDTYDTIDWLIKNIPNNNGRVGIWGVSYPGFYSSMALLDAHPALVAASPQAPIADWFIDDDFHRNGAFYLLQAVNFMRYWAPRQEPTQNSPNSLLRYPKPNLYDFLLELGSVSTINEKYFKDRVKFWNLMMEHGTYDEFWQARNILPHLKNIQTAVLMVGGWFDAEDLYGPLKTYAAIEKNNPGVQNSLVMGPWYHGGWRGVGPEKLGDILVYASRAGKYFQDNILFPFFNYHLKGEGELNLPEAFVYETGSNVWQLYDKWPPENIEKKGLYLHRDNKLSFEEPSNTEEDVSDEYLSDPNKPVPHLGNTIYRWSYDFMHADQRYAATRPDVLVFESDVLKEDVTIAGPIKAVLYVSTTGTDADWVVKLIDVYPDNAPDPVPNPAGVRMGGYQTLVRGEIMRGKFRNSFEKPEPFVPEKITKVEFELQDINHTFLKRHKIMVQIQSTWFPLFDRNPQKFVDIYSAKKEDFEKAVHRVYHSKEYPSHLKVNVVLRPVKK